MRRDRRVSRKARGYARGPHLIRRGAVWWLYLGHGERVSLDTTDAAEARARVPDALKRHAAAVAARGRAGEKALDVIAEAYVRAPHGWSRRTLSTTTSRVIAFVEAMAERGVTHPSLVSPAALDAWRKARMATRSRVTINRDEIVARRMLAWGAAQGMCGPTPLAERKALKEPRRKPAPLIPSPDELARVVAALGAIEATARAEAASDPKHRVTHAQRADAARGAALTIAVALATGLRLDELRHMTDGDITARAVSVTPERGPADAAWQSKSYKERAIPVSDGAARAARAFVAWRTEGRGGKGKRVGLAGTWIADWIDRAAPVANVPRFRMHDVRRTFATECVRGGIPITTVRDWMGHRDVQTTERYLGRYRSDADLVAPTPAALDVLGRMPANVVPIANGRKG